MNNLFFEDSFTQVGDNINLNVNQLSTSCITSNNNSFNLDIEGNLIVKSIGTTEPVSNVNHEELLNFVYPIGSIYISVSDINPSNLFGGGWEVFASGRTIVGFDNNQTEFNSLMKTGGNKNLQSHNHTATTNQTGSHKHGIKGYWKFASGTSTNAKGAAYEYQSGDPETTNTPILSSGSHSHAVTVNNAGSGDSGNLQPYIVVRMWKRIL